MIVVFTVTTLVAILQRLFAFPAEFRPRPSPRSPHGRAVCIPIVLVAIAAFIVGSQHAAAVRRFQTDSDGFCAIRARMCLQSTSRPLTSPTSGRGQIFYF